ncbi:CBS domain-containing protein [Geoalkalibacter ferrihydriticus]|uniref:Signal transduction protein n=2 Tax=Geoalkalibacter ferrihydriticus TaxID=392333 RepID=A0A0C2HW07_9BACT|nr:putative nucleotidyltransferase substrate binding domain-containing protein [Geoalkalibacter ferrihydriticus]KIH76937.1 signal transduction protein [Geoalkalibacter ferrihydriticus DSM 17813]SDL43637.1 CBS domain-containing protein [Geoalkalibacter ferrihydriticus]
MPAENVFFLPVKDFCQRNVVTCSPDQRLVEAAEIMREKNISSVVVCDGSAPIGILTDRDLRNKVIARGLDPQSLIVHSIMNAPLIVVREEDFLFEALYRMTHHNIHRVGVVDRTGKLTGIITNSDILRLQSRSPQQVMRDIEHAQDVDELKKLHRQVQELVVHLLGTGVATRDLVRTIAHLNDRLLIRLIALTREQSFPDLTDRFAFLVLGSEGRGEQTLTTDQDNAIVYADDLPPADIARLEKFSQILIDNLISIGVPPCPGGIMAKNEAWRRSLQSWTKVLDRWMGSATPENILNGSMFFDLRTLHGDESFERALKEQVAENLQRNDGFLARTAANVQRFKPPLGLFGRIKVETEGDYIGMLDVKKAGIFAITEGIKVLALEAGIFTGGTRERMHALQDAKVLGRKLVADLEASFDFLVSLRLRGQVSALKAGRDPINYIALTQLNRMETGRLRLALQEVKAFQEILGTHFQTTLFR